MEAEVQPMAEVSSPAKQDRFWTCPGPLTLTVALATCWFQPFTANQRSSSTPPDVVTAPLTSYSTVSPVTVSTSPLRVPPLTFAIW